MSSMQYALDMGAKALQALEEYVGHRYTLGKMDFIAIDDFLMGAMVRRRICYTTRHVRWTSWCYVCSLLQTIISQSLLQENWGLVSFK